MAEDNIAFFQNLNEHIRTLTTLVPNEVIPSAIHAKYQALGAVSIATFFTIDSQYI